MSNRSANGSTRHWRNLRAKVLRERPTCEECRAEPATEVDHIMQLAHGGPRFDRANLRALCNRCHVRRHGKRPRQRFDAGGFVIWQGA